MQRLRYINARGHEIDFTTTAPYVFWKVDGLSMPEATPIRSQAAGQNGYTLHSIVLEERYIKLTGHIHGKAGLTDMYGLRVRLEGIINPTLGPGTLVYENDYGMWKIQAFCNSSPYLEKMREFQTLSVNFICPSPYWQNYNADEILLSYVYGGLMFPIKTPGYFGVLGYIANIDNDSDDEIPIELTMEGGAVNPVITNKTTGAFIKLTQDIPEGTKLYMNTDPEKLEVSLISIDPNTNGEIRTNAYGYLTTDSSLMKIVQGMNQLTFASDDDTKNVKIKITFYKRYVGV